MFIELAILINMSNNPSLKSVVLEFFCQSKPMLSIWQHWLGLTKYSRTTGSGCKTVQCGRD